MEGKKKERSSNININCANVLSFSYIYFFLWPFILELLLSVGFIFPRRLLLLTFIRRARYYSLASSSSSSDFISV